MFIAKRTNFSKFRERYDVIEDLTGTHTDEGMVEILAERHDLTLTTGTLTNYLYRHRKELNKLSVATDTARSKIENNHEGTEQGLDDSKNRELAQENETDVDADSYTKPPREQLNAAMAEFKRSQKTRKSLFDR